MKRVGIYIPLDMYDWLVKQAEESHEGKESAYVRQLIREKMKKK